MITLVRAFQRVFSPDGDGRLDLVSVSYRIDERAQAIMLVDVRQRVQPAWPSALPTSKCAFMLMRWHNARPKLRGGSTSKESVAREGVCATSCDNRLV